MSEVGNPDRDDEDASPPPEDEDDSAEMRELLRKVAAAPSIDPSAFTNGRLPVAGGFQPGEKLGHFRILERIGAGGMGVVYRAEDERLRRPVALKVLPPHQVFDRQRRRRLWREAQSAAAVNHPNIASIYELGEDEAGTVFIAMEYLGGQPLRRYTQDAALSPREALAFAVQIAQGLARAHAAGIVHRDLKPDNVMVLQDRTLKILDFGLAKLLAAPEEKVPSTGSSESADAEGSAATKDGQVVGTPRYMSPEQKSGALVDARADIYAFGVLLFELLTNTWPDADRRDAPALEKDSEAARMRAGPQAPLVSALVAVCTRALQRAPAARYADGNELLEALREVQARFDPSVGGRRGPRGRRGFGFAAASLVVVGLVAITAWRFLSPPPTPLGELSGGGESRLLERRLTANPPDNPVRDAALSPDGRTLAYVDRSGLFLRAVDPPSTTQVPFKEKITLLSVAWLPSGDSVLVAGRAHGDTGTQIWEVARSGTARRVAAGLFERPRPSPDGKRLAWVEPKGIAEGPIEGAPGRGRIVVEAGGDELDELAWSPDGRHLAYLRVRGTPDGVEARLETVAREGGPPALVLQNSRLIQENGGGALAWASDGRMIFALAERPPHETGFTLWSVTVDVATAAPTEHPRMVRSWSGSTPGLLTVAAGALAYARTETQSDVYVADLLEGGRRLQHPRRLTLSDRNERPSGWSHGGAEVLFTSDQDGSNDIFEQDVATGSVRRLVVTRASETWAAQSGAGELLYWEHPFSADDTAPHHAVLRERTSDGTLREVLTTTARCDHAGGELAPTRAQFRCPARGDCILGEASGGTLRFTAFSPEEGRRARVLELENPGRGGTGWDLSRDGARIAVPGANGQMRIVELATGKSVDRYLQQGCELHHLAFNADGTGVFATATCAGDRPYKLYFAEPHRGAQVLWDSSSTWFGFPTVSPDGRYLAFAVRPLDNDVWLASGF